MPAGMAIARAAAALVVGLVLGEVAAEANTTVLGGSFAEACSRAARQAADGSAWDDQAVFACSMAVETETLRPHERAATYVNRGTLFLAQANYGSAMSDFDSALEIEPGLGEAYTDRGAARIARHDFTGGIADIDHGLLLNPEEPEKAYYNRAIADENTGDAKAAYFDYLHASQLKPSWDAPKKELARFKVKMSVQ